MAFITNIKNVGGSAFKGSVNRVYPNAFRGDDSISDIFSDNDNITITKKTPIAHQAVIRGCIAPKGFKDVSEVMTFQFNPSEVTDKKANDWQSSQQMGFAHNEYIWMNGGARTISFTLMFEATASVNTAYFGRDIPYGDAHVQDLKNTFPEGTMGYVNRLRSYLYPLDKDSGLVTFVGGNPSPQNRFTHPPVLIFCYGSYYVECILTSADISHSLFNDELKPIRSSANVTLDVLEGYTLNIDKRLRA